MSASADHQTLFFRRAATAIVAQLLFVAAPSGPITRAESPQADHLVRDGFGAVIRADPSIKKLALVFTGDEYGESTAPILESLRQRKIKAAFFVTGNFLRQPALRAHLKRAVAEGHYVGPHSDSHPLYAPWDNRNKSLVTRAFFERDLQRNLADLRHVGALQRGQPVLFIPPYEHFNRDQLAWSRAMGVTLINFTPGSGSNRDYAREGDPHFVGAQKIYDDVLAYEQKDPHGLNGFLLLLHLGSGRKDPFHPLLGRLIDELAKRGYQFKRVDALVGGRLM
jgi:endoglucanase